MRDIEKGMRAEQITKYPVFQEALSGLRSELLGFIAQSAPSNIQDRERTYLMLKLLDRFEDHFQTMIDNGKIAKQKLTEIDGDSKLTKLKRVLR